MNPESTPSYQAEWDAGDLGCGELVMDLMMRMRKLESGQVMRLVASDPGAGNLTRYGRPPTGINGKLRHRDKHGQPFTQRAHIWSPDCRYTPEQIAQAYGFDLEAASKPRAKRKGSKPASARMTFAPSRPDMPPIDAGSVPPGSVKASDSTVASIAMPKNSTPIGRHQA